MLQASARAPREPPQIVEERIIYQFIIHNTHSGGNSLSSSMVPRNPNRVLICSDVVLGETFVTWITCVLEFIFASAIVELAICQQRPRILNRKDKNRKRSQLQKHQATTKASIFPKDRWWLVFLFCFWGFFFPPDSPTIVSTEQQCHCPNCREVALDTSGTVCRIVLKNFSSIYSRHRVKNICRTFDLFKRWSKIILIIVDCTVLLIKSWHFGFEGGI